MKTILTIRKQDFDPAAEVIDSSDFSIRTAARAVVIDKDGRVALLKVGLYSFHKLPGGGIDEGEDTETALRREINEEIGCDVSDIEELGTVEEYIDHMRLRQTSYCFIAKQIGEKGEPDFTEKELLHEFSIKWVSSIDEGIQTLKADTPTHESERFILKRDLAILAEAKKKLN